MINHTMEQISELKLQGLKAALSEQLEQGHLYAEMSFEERLSHLIDREVTQRKNRTIKRRLAASKLKYKEAHLPDLDYRSQRGLNRAQIQALSSNQWIGQQQKTSLSLAPPVPGKLISLVHWPTTLSDQAALHITPGSHHSYHILLSFEPMEAISTG